MWESEIPPWCQDQGLRLSKALSSAMNLVPSVEFHHPTLVIMIFFHKPLCC